MCALERSKRIQMAYNIVLAVVLALNLAGGVVQHRSLEDARLERQHLTHKYIKLLNKEEGAIRLVGGDNEYEGNIEVLHNGKWGAVCDDEWDSAEGHIVCRQLGFPGMRRLTRSGYFGPARRRFWMDNLFCEGHEQELVSCHFEGWGENDCEPGEAAGVICYPPENAVIPLPVPILREEDLPKYPIHARSRLYVRLRGGRSRNEGRVEVSLDGGRWGSVCADGWSLLEANVVCRQLGLGYASEAFQTDFFGGINVSRPVLSGSECFGNETELADCLHHDVRQGVVSCHGNRQHVAAVICDFRSPDLVVDYLEIEQTAHLEDRPMLLMQCAMEENCVANEAYQIQRDDPHWRYRSRRLLKFTAAAINAGNADFRPFKEKSQWEWHMCHMHFHSMEVFATFDIFDLSGRKVAQGHKASFCLEDSSCLPGVPKKYSCANYGDQGISINCSDVYLYNLDCQWVDITDLSPGSYVLKIAINPEFKVAEMSFDNNAAICDLIYTENLARVLNCQLGRP
ncbi:LOW QUALITY PROTEIN: lysyl oxidase homolog 3A [Drosophila bipectinata]|uniref:LOW QUALITY PROTEIN: lysyl oxidase homolog 3A n=1 Tax=Drosophila bipectinata TaxID=42026 RepID=UPI001C897ECD|nr:LOW QUALITY PROTEIN: lysyl oxidase homolog 3B [Drosophila bipectinata]